MSDHSQYDADYFLRGKESGKSLYTEYRWLPELTIPMARAIVNHCDIEEGARVLDFGCARGYTVKALRWLGYDAYGMDISAWAIENADPEAQGFVERIDPKASPHEPLPVNRQYDWIIAKDVLEHVEYVRYAILNLRRIATKGIFAVVPLSTFDQGEYVIKEYEKDVTHIHRWRLQTWIGTFLDPGWEVTAAFRVPGVKDNYWKPDWERGNGFITARRIMSEHPKQPDQGTSEGVL